MPAIGAGGGIQRGAALPKPPAPRVALPPILPPPAAPRGVPSARDVNAATNPAPTATSRQTAVQSIGAAKAANAVRSAPKPALSVLSGNHGPGYHQAIKAVFLQQAPQHQAAILKNVLAGKADASTQAAIKDAWNSLGDQQKFSVATQLHQSSWLSKFLSGGAAAVLGSDGAIHGSKLGPAVEHGLQDAAKTVNSLIQKIPTSGSTGTEQAAIQTNSGLGPGQLGKNFLKDAVDLPAEVAPSIAIPVGKALSGDWKGALNTVTEPYAQTFGQGLKHFAQAAGKDPLNTYLMAAGVLHPALRAAEFGGRTVLGKGPVDLQAPSVSLTANLTHERPNFSPYPLIRKGQKVVGEMTYEHNAHGLLVPKDELVRARLTKLETSRLVGQGERVRRAAHETQLLKHKDSVILPLKGRVAHGVKTALRYDPKPALVPGADVLSLIARGVIRRPATYAADLAKHIKEVASTRPELLDFPVRLAAHDKYVKELKAALAKAPAPKELGPAFEAATTYAKDYAGKGGLESQAHALGHMRDMAPEALQRRALMGAVDAHMPGARMDPELGMVKDTKAGVRKLSTAEMQAFVDKETGGRPVSYVSDKGAMGDSAHYVKQEVRPRPAAMGNTLYNLKHGLVDPSHVAMLEQRAHTQGIINAHHTTNRLDQQLVLMPGKNGQLESVTPSHKGWATYQDAKRDAPDGYQPIQLAQQFHPQDLLAKSLTHDNVDMSTLQNEATMHRLDINARLSPSETQGRYGIINSVAANQLKAHENLISPGAFLRGMRGITGQFRKVALGTSFRHLPGVAQEVAIRAASSGVGPISLLAGRAAIRRAEELDPRIGGERHVQLTGGTVTGQALNLATRQVSRHFEGTLLQPPLRAWEAAVRTPVLRQMHTLWRSWLHFALTGTKHVLEENAQIAGVGRQVINDFGGRHGLMAKVMGNWGKMIDQAAHGILDENTARRMGAGVRQIYGRWTDLTPGEQQVLMFSPFGMWWTNSVAWLARFPIDHPVGAAFQAALHEGTQKQRERQGLDMFSPNRLPLYKQGGIDIGGQLWGANYYSPAGVLADPGTTAASLIAPWQQEIIRAVSGKDWKGDPITSPTNPSGRGKPSPLDVFTVIANSLASNFLPLYQKAQTLVQGGASSYSTSTFLNPETKGPNPGLAEGLKKDVMPIRLGAAQAGGGATAPPTNVYHLPNAGGNTYSLPSTAGNTYSLPGAPGGNTYSLPKPGG